MPESPLRRKRLFTAPPTASGAVKPSPRWFAPTMIGLLLLGLVWVVTYYVSRSEYPIPDIGDYNLAIGFGILFVGFILLTRWR